MIDITTTRVDMNIADVDIYRRDGARAWYACVLMTLCLGLSLMDRASISLVVGPIKGDFKLSDSSMGLLIGGTFAISYALLAVPFATLADRGNRCRLIALGVIVWCISTLCSGLATNVPVLFATRIGVAAGEAMLMPAATSLLADHFSPARRTQAMSVFGLGTFFGNALALLAGGALYGLLKAHPMSVAGRGVEAWRAVMVVLGGVGLFVVPFLWSMREPPRLSDHGGQAIEPIKSVEALRQIRSKTWAICSLFVGFATIALAIFAFNAWAPTLFIRIYHWSVKDTGIRLGLFPLILGPAGLFTGAAISDALRRRGRMDSNMIVGLASGIVCAVGAIAVTLPSLTAALIGMGVLTYAVSFDFGVQHAALVEILPNRLRAQGMAVYSVLTAVFSMTLGPLAVGLLSDHLPHDPSAIATSLRLVGPIGFLLATAIFALGLGAYRRAMREYELERVAVAANAA